jgi:hypothetical protein
MSNFLDDNLNQSVFFDINYLEVLGRKAYPPALLLRVIFTLVIEVILRVALLNVYVKQI